VRQRPRHALSPARELVIGAATTWYPSIVGEKLLMKYFFSGHLASGICWSSCSSRSVRHLDAGRAEDVAPADSQCAVGSELQHARAVTHRGTLEAASGAIGILDEYRAVRAGRRSGARGLDVVG
jgi:hypothetical protein